MPKLLFALSSLVLLPVLLCQQSPDPKPSGSAPKAPAQPRTWVHAHPPHARRCLENFRRSGLKPCHGFLLVAACGWSREDVDVALEVGPRLKAAGFAVIPGISHMISKKLGPSAWFDRQIWVDAAQRVRRIAAAGLDPQKRIVIDFEPYFDTQPRYTQLSTSYRLAKALEPLIDALAETESKPVLLPGGLNYAAYPLLTAKVPTAIICDEATYKIATGELKDWRTLVTDRLSGARAVGDEYWPGLFGVALHKRNSQLLAQLGELGCTDVWFYFRRAPNNPSRDDRLYYFGQATWNPGASP